MFDISFPWWVFSIEDVLTFSFLCNGYLTYLYIIDPDSEVVIFAKKTVKDLKLPPAFITQIAQSIQVSGCLKRNIPQEFSTLTTSWLSYSCTFSIMCYCSHNWLNFDHLKGKICTLGRRLSLSRFVLVSTWCLFFHMQTELHVCANVQRLVIGKQNYGLIGASLSSSSQLDLRVNHTLIKDQFLWVSLLENEYQVSHGVK